MYSSITKFDCQYNKEEFNKNGEEERPCCGGHCHCNHDADGDHVCHCHEEVEPEFNLENKDEE